jgi:hypothetical protein
MTKANTSLKRRSCDALGNLHQFIARDDTLRQRAKKRRKLMPEVYEARIQKLNGDDPIAPKDADATKENISGICRKFKR